jgi:hypothetical protein
MVLNARFDGKVIVPDEPLNLPANQRVRISVEPIAGEAPPKKRIDFGEWLGLAKRAPQNPNPKFKSDDDDVLWEKDPR